MSGVELMAGGLTVDGQRRRLGPPLLLEFVGLPGAGKTTIAARLVRELRARGTTCAERRGEREADAGRMRRHIRRAGDLLRNHDLTLALLRFAASVRPVSLTRLTRALKVAGWGRRLGSLARADVDVVVLDQGPVQDAWSITVPGRRWSEVAMRSAVRRLQTVDIPRVFIFVDVSIDTACDRLQQRPGANSRFDRLSPARTRTWLARYERSLSSVFQYAVAVADAPVLRLDGRLPVEEQCREVAHFIDGTRATREESLPPATVVAGDAP